MKNKIILLLIMSLFLIFSFGCNSNSEQITIEENNEDTPPKGDMELVEKRGEITNITEFKKLSLRASAIENYKYNVTDSKLLSPYYLMGKGRFYRVILPSTLKHESGNIFDTVYLDRKTKNALSRCQPSTCQDPKDMELEHVNYEYFYRLDPTEIMSGFFDASYIETSVIKNDYVKVFSGNYLGTDAKIWVQEYWGYPIKLEIYGDKPRTIEFNDVEIDTTRNVEVQPPTFFTVLNESGEWWYWEHYLGELSREQIEFVGQNIKTI